MNIIVSDKEQQPYTGFLADAIDQLALCNVKGIAIVALTEGGDAVTGYWNMSLRDKNVAETEIRYDAMDQFIRANKGRYR